MFQIAHIMVLSQPEFLQSRVRRLFDEQPTDVGPRRLWSNFLSRAA
jgi:hypothetical protein